MVLAKFSIKDDNDDIIFETETCGNEGIPFEVQKKIVNYLKDCDSDKFSCLIRVEDVEDNNSMYTTSKIISYPKSIFLKELSNLFIFFNEHVAALPVCHSSIGGVTVARCGVCGDGDDDVSDVSGVSDELNVSDVSDVSDDEAVSGVSYKSDAYGDNPRERFIDMLARQLDTQNLILDTLPGMLSTHGHRGGISHCNKRCKQDDEEQNVQTQTLNQFITYLRTYKTWAELIQDLQLHTNQPTNNQHIIQKYQKWQAQNQAEQEKTQ